MESQLPQYVESETKMVADESLSSYHMLGELSSDKYGIAWTGIPHAKNFPNLKPLALAASEGGPYIEPAKETFRTGPIANAQRLHVYQAPAGSGRRSEGPRVSALHPEP